jgi:hypothetical protein
MSDRRAEATQMLTSVLGHLPTEVVMTLDVDRILDLITRGLAAEEAERGMEARAVHAEREAAARARRKRETFDA